MRLSLGLGPLGAALLLAAALPLADGSVGPAGAQTAGAQKAPAQGRKAVAKRPAGKTPAKGAAADGKGAGGTAEIERVLDAAAKSLADGNADAAMTALDGVLTGGGLASNHMARALYLRGVAHRKKGRPAQAISDLTSAIWLKDGLSEADRTAALKERSEVSREVGVADTGVPATSGRQAPAAQTAQAPAAQKGLIGRTPTPGSPGLSEGGFPRVAEAAPQRAAPTAAPPAPTTQEPPAQTGQAPAAPKGLITRPPALASPGLTEGGFPRVTSTAEPAARTPPPAREAKSAGRATSSWQSGTSTSTQDGWVPAEERAKSRAASAPSSPDGAPGSGGGVGEFFSGLFGGTPAAPPPPARTAKSAEAPSWSTSTRGPETKRPAEKSRAVATAAIPPAPKEVQGAYRLQIATVRSRTEAEAVAARVRKEHGRVIGARKLEVDETVFGNMGTFYRVRLGPFAAANEPKSLCDQLRTQGYDCLVVTQ